MLQRLPYIFLCLVLALPASSAELAAQGPGGLSSLTNQIALKELQLARINAQLKLGDHPNIWYMRRWQLTQITNNILTSSGAFLNGATSLHYLHHPDKLPKHVVAAASLERALANFISTSEATMEFGIDFLHARRDKREQKDLKSLRRKAVALHKDISNLLQARQAAVAALAQSGQPVEQFELEAQALQHFHAAAANEFIRLYSEATGRKVRKELNQLMSLLANAESGATTMVGYYATLTTHGSPAERIHLSGTAAIGDLIGGAIIASAPSVSRLVGHAYQRHAARHAAQEMGCTTTEVVEAKLLRDDCTRLSDISQSQPEAANAELILTKNLCEFGNSMLCDYEQISQREHSYARRSYIESQAAAASGGGSKINNGIGSAVGDFAFDKTTRARLEWIGGPAIAYGVGNAVGAGINIHRRISDEKRAKRLEREHKSTEQIIGDQLHRMQRLEASIPASAPVVGSR